MTKRLLPEGNIDMKVLMVAPQPYFRPRGTPFSIADRLKGLTQLGYTVHLVTYPFGENRAPPNVGIDRIPHVPGIKDIRIGPSLAKIPLDIVLLLKCLWILMKEKKYCAIHTHEEGALIGVIARFLFRIPHVYDMHSSLCQQMANFEFTKNPLILKMMKSFEKLFLKYSDSIIVVCPRFKNHVKNVVGDRDGVFLIENLPLWKDFDNDPQKISKKKSELGIKNQIVIFYAGTFEPYQGLDLLLESANLILNERNDFLFLIIGGNKTQTNRFQNQIIQKGLEKRFLLTGQIPAEEIPQYAEISDILVSPRKTGINIPLKIYSYLKSGKPILATRLFTHTQILNDDVACLVSAEATSVANGILYLMNNPDKAQKLAESARKLANDKYTFFRYLEKLQKTYKHALSKS